MGRRFLRGLALGQVLLTLCGCRSAPGDVDWMAVPSRLPAVVTRLPPVPDTPEPSASPSPSDVAPPGAQLHLEDGSCALSLHDALLLSLRHSDIAKTLDGGSVGIEERTVYDPVIAAEARKVAIAAFDTNYAANFFWNRFEGPPNSFFGPGIPRSERRDEATFATGFTKRWGLGTESRLFYNPNPGYLYYPDGATGFNPNHVSALELALRQPLLRGAGSEMNEAPITIAQLRTDQSAWEFKKSTLRFVRSVEEAYWNLQAARVSREVLAEQLPLIEEVVRIEEEHLSADRAIVADVAKTKAQLHLLRQRLAEAKSEVEARELQLRTLIGVEFEGCQLIPTTEPIRAPMIIDPDVSIATALDYQPSLIRDRIELRVREVQLRVAQNQYRPQLDLQALYRMNGLEEELDRSLDMMLDQDFVDWEFGAQFSMPLGRNADRARVRTAEVQLQRDRAMLRENVRLVIYELRDVLRRIDAYYEQYREADSRLRVAREWLHGARIRYENPPPVGSEQNWMLIALDDYLLAMRNVAEAAADSSFFLASYNTELARLKEVEGTLLVSNNIFLFNDPCSPNLLDQLPKLAFSEYSDAISGAIPEKSRAVMQTRLSERAKARQPADLWNR